MFCILLLLFSGVLFSASPEFSMQENDGFGVALFQISDQEGQAIESSLKETFSSSGLGVQRVSAVIAYGSPRMLHYKYDLVHLKRPLEVFPIYVLGRDEEQELSDSLCHIFFRIEEYVRCKASALSLVGRYQYPMIGNMMFTGDVESPPVCIMHNNLADTVETIKRIKDSRPLNIQEHPWAYQYKSWADALYQSQEDLFEPYQ